MYKRQVIATPGNHEYQKDSETKRIWTNKDGQPINIEIESLNNDNPKIFIVDIEDFQNRTGTIKIKDSGEIIDADEGIE